jgi:hypothetical protein
MSDEKALPRRQALLCPVLSDEFPSVVVIATEGLAYHASQFSERWV